MDLLLRVLELFIPWPHISRSAVSLLINFTSFLWIKTRVLKLHFIPKICSMINVFLTFCIFFVLTNKHYSYDYS